MTQVQNPPLPGRPTTEPARRARRSALQAASRAGVTLRPLESLGDVQQAEQLLLQVWRPSDGHPPLAADLMQALVSAGSYVAGAYDGTRMVGVCVGFWSDPLHPHLHSHIAGVVTTHRGRHVGHALKLDQRAHALERGIPLITWTYDPLLARNAHFNLRRLGALPAGYLVNHYGAMADELNAGDESDRLLVHWDLAGAAAREACDPVEDRAARATTAVVSRAVARGADDRPVASNFNVAGPVAVAVPHDIETLRRTSPAVAREWRATVRTALTILLDRGGRITDFDREQGHYVVEGAR